MNFEELTPEQLRRCVREMPWEALKYWEDELGAFFAGID